MRCDNIRYFREATHLPLAPYPHEDEDLDAFFEELFKHLAGPEAMVLFLDGAGLFEEMWPGAIERLQVLWRKFRDEALKSGRENRLFLVLTTSAAHEGARNFLTDFPADERIHLHPWSRKVLNDVLHRFNPEATPADELTLHALTGGLPQAAADLLLDGLLTRRQMLETAAEPDGPYPKGKYAFAAESRARRSLFVEGVRFRHLRESWIPILEAIGFGLMKRRDLLEKFKGGVSSVLLHLERKGAIERIVPVGLDAGDRRRQKARYRIVDGMTAVHYGLLGPNKEKMTEEHRTEMFEIARATWPKMALRAEIESRTEELRSQGYTKVGPWWDAKGENDIGLVGIDPEQKRVIFVEVATEGQQDPLGLEPQIEAFFKANPEMRSWARHDAFVGGSIAADAWPWD